MVGLMMVPTSPVLPSICCELKLAGNSVSGNRRLPPFCSVAGSCALISLVAPTSALPPAGGTSCLPPEHAARARAATRATTAKRRIFMATDVTRDAVSGGQERWERRTPAPAELQRADGGCHRAADWLIPGRRRPTRRFCPCTTPQHGGRDV